MTVQDYSPFGALMDGRQTSATDSKYGFNGMRKDDELKGSGNSYDFGARLYDSRLGRWLSVDPLGYKTPNLSPYLYCNASPIIFVDKEGESAEIVVDKASKTITFKSHIILYGHQASTELATQSASDIQNAWNDGAKGYMIDIDGTSYSVKFEVTGEYNPNLSLLDVLGNKDLKNNYIRVENNTERDHSYQHSIDSDGDGYSDDGGNTGIWTLSDVQGAGTKSEPHEYGHGLGLVRNSKNKGHAEDENLLGEGQPSMMNARGTLVDADFRYDNWFKLGYRGLDPNKRKVTNTDLDMLKNVVIESIGNKRVSINDKLQIVIAVGVLTNRYIYYNSSIHEKKTSQGASNSNTNNNATNSTPTGP